ncbi:MAG: hypothetical protein ACTSR3_13350 [Candidatus Helarchaeota archaeon]
MSFDTSMCLDENLISGLFIALNTFAKESGKGAIENLILKEAKFVYMNFGPIFVVIGCDPADDIKTIKEIMNAIGNSFIKEYGTLEDWDNNIAKFRSFSNILYDEFAQWTKPRPKPPEPVSPQLLSKEELIVQEYKLLSSEYTCEMIKGLTTNINVFISRNLEEHFIININFKDYPEKPKVKFPRELKKELGKPDEALLTLTNWNPENPARIVEIIRELESYILRPSSINLNSL